MVAPGRGGNVDSLGVRVVTRNESAANAEGTSAGNGLRYSDLELTGSVFQMNHLTKSTHAALGKRRAICAVCELGREFCKVAETCDREILLVTFASQNLLCLYVYKHRPTRHLNVCTPS